MAQTLMVKNTLVSVIKVGEEDFLSLTDIARFKSEEPNAVIANWLRNRNTIEYLGIWESLYNADFKPLEFEGFKKEADVLNVALFGITAKEWREANSDLKGNIRDYATINQLICLSNLENLNAVFIQKGMEQNDRLTELNKIAIQQMKVLEAVEDRKLLK